jgi:uncharacterized membrane protein
LAVKEVEVSVTIRARGQECFDFVADPANVPRFMYGVKRYEPIGGRTRGRGAHFSSVISLGGRDIDAELEVTGWSDGEHMVATSTRGPKTRGSWTFEEYDDGTTDVTLTQEYELPGLFKLLPQGPIHAGVERELKRSLERLKTLIEGGAKAPARPPRKPSRTARG